MEEAFKAARTLPEETQREIAGGILAMVEAHHASGLTDAQKETVSERLSRSRVEATRDEFLTLLRRYNGNI